MSSRPLPLRLVIALFAAFVTADAGAQPAPHDLAATQPAATRPAAPRSREDLIAQLFGPTPTVKTAGSFTLICDPAAAPLAECALAALLAAHHDVTNWAREMRLFYDKRPRQHVVLFFDSFERYRAAVQLHAPQWVERSTVGHYDFGLRCLFWYDQRTGIARQKTLKGLADRRDDLSFQRDKLAHCRRTGEPFTVVYRGHPARSYELAEAERFIAELEANLKEMEAQLDTLESAVAPDVLRHEAAHQILHEHRTLPLPAPLWLSEGLAVLFESVERPRGVARLDLPPPRLGSLRRFLGGVGAIDSLNPDNPYPLDRIAAALDLPDLLNTRGSVTSPLGERPGYYARYAALTYFLLETRRWQSAELIRLCARRHAGWLAASRHDQNPTSPADLPTAAAMADAWRADFHRAFDLDDTPAAHQRLQADFALFISDLLRRDDQRPATGTHRLADDDARDPGR